MVATLEFQAGTVVQRQAVPKSEGADSVAQPTVEVSVPPLSEVANAGEEAFNDDLKKELVGSVRSIVGAFAAPGVIHFAPTGLPKTRSGKIMRRILRKIASNEENQIGDTTW